MMARVNDFAELSGSGAGKPRVLFVSNLFPDSASTYLGLDNATLLHQLREFCDLRVICPKYGKKARIVRKKSNTNRTFRANLHGFRSV